ncbi:hypothetical protein HDU79_001572, partial [Rhizoclosmatium sp. JEL0117]
MNGKETLKLGFCSQDSRKIRLGALNLSKECGKFVDLRLQSLFQDYMKRFPEYDGSLESFLKLPASTVSYAPKAAKGGFRRIIGRNAVNAIESWDRTKVSEKWRKKYEESQEEVDLCQSDTFTNEDLGGFNFRLFDDGSVFQVFRKDIGANC